ncbi:MAG: AI-2E family transporter, partial [Planctomycetales bacterium]|nr:AI-2E family transporter [Planctomycetales bacterium]
ESAASQTNATGAADQRRRDRAALAVQSKRLLLGNLIDVDELLHHAFEEWGEQEPLATQLTKLAETYDEEIGQAQAAYRNMRQQLQGGPTLAWMTELANPSESEMQVWRGKAAAQLQKWLLSMTGQTTALLVRLLVGLGIMTLGMYYFLIDGPAMITTAMRLSPLDDDYERELLVEFDQVSRAVVLATLLSAAAQGLLAGIGYYFAGLHSIFLLTALTAILALVPFVGAAAVWVPACLYLWLVQDRIVPAGVLAAYGFGVISMADNLIKPMVLHGQSKLHPLLALLSVLGGVQVLGPIGILVGPMVVSFLQALLNMLHKELAHMDGQTPRQRK